MNCVIFIQSSEEAYAFRIIEGSREREAQSGDCPPFLAYRFALDRKGLSVARASRRLEVVMPPAEVARELHIGSFEPAVFISSTGYTKLGQAVEYSESYSGNARRSPETVRPSWRIASKIRIKCASNTSAGSFALDGKCRTGCKTVPLPSMGAALISVPPTSRQR